MAPWDRLLSDTKSIHNASSLEDTEAFPLEQRPCRPKPQASCVLPSSRLMIEAVMKLNIGNWNTNVFIVNTEMTQHVISDLDALFIVHLTSDSLFSLTSSLVINCSSYLV